MKRPRRSRQQWHQLITEFHASGMSQAAFAEKLRCSEKTVERWCLDTRKSALPPRKKKPAFVEVKSVAVVDAPSAAALRVEGPMGFAAVFGDLPPATYVAEIMAALRLSKC